MRGILEKLKLIDSVVIELPINKAEFIELLKNNIDGKQSDFFDVFSSSKNEYKGVVTADGFELRKKRRLFEMNMNAAKAVGVFEEEEDGRLIIDTEINGFQGQVKLMYSGFIIFYIVFISVFLFAGDDNMPLFVLPFILFHASFMLGIPYFFIRRSVRRLKYDLERDLYYMATKRKAVGV